MSSLPQNATSVQPLVFAEDPSLKLFCTQCNNVFTDPVLAAGCGHSFCRECTAGFDKCPIDHKDFQLLVPNIALVDHVGELLVYCKYGCKLSEDKTSHVYDVDGCPEILKLSNRNEHEAACDYATVVCPQNSACPPIRKKDLDDHLSFCQKVFCSYQKYGCAFYGFEQDLDGHLAACPYEAMKDYLQRNDERYKKLQINLENTNGELEFVKGALSSRMETLEILETTQQRLCEELVDTKKNHEILAENFEQMRDVVNALSFQYQAVSQNQLFRCMGTFVGHQGPVWCLTMQGDLLYTGSSDKTIKVWHTGNEYKCIRTLEGHTDAVLCLTIFGSRLFSGGKDTMIREWNTDRFEFVKEIKSAHNNYSVCALASTKSFLFSGSNLSVKIWDISTLQMLHECVGFQTWVRCLATRDGVLFAGADVIKVISLANFEEITTLTFTNVNIHAYSLLEVENLLVCGTGTGSLCIWDSETYAPVATMTGHTDRINCLAALQTPNGSIWKVFSASTDRSVRVWRLDSRICTQSLVRHQGGVLALAVSKGRLFSGSVDTTIKVWVYGI